MHVIILISGILRDRQAEELKFGIIKKLADYLAKPLTIFVPLFIKIVSFLYAGWGRSVYAGSFNTIQSTPVLNIERAACVVKV